MDTELDELGVEIEEFRVQFEECIKELNEILDD